MTAVRRATRPEKRSGFVGIVVTTKIGGDVTFDKTLWAELDTLTSPRTF